MSGNDSVENIMQVELVRPQLTVRLFKNLDAALDFCRMVQPEGMQITKDSNAWMVQYWGSEGMQ